MVRMTGLDLHFSFSVRKRKLRKKPVFELVSASVPRTLAYKWVLALSRRKKQPDPIGVELFLVRMTGLEPARSRVGT